MCVYLAQLKIKIKTKKKKQQNKILLLKMELKKERTIQLTESFLSSFFSVPPEPVFLSCCSLSRCFFDFLFFFFIFGSDGGFSSGSDSLSLSLELKQGIIQRIKYGSLFPRKAYRCMLTFHIVAKSSHFPDVNI